MKELYSAFSLVAVTLGSIHDGGANAFAFSPTRRWFARTDAVGRSGVAPGHGSTFRFSRTDEERWPYDGLYSKLSPPSKTFRRSCLNGSGSGTASALFMSDAGSAGGEFEIGNQEGGDGANNQDDPNASEIVGGDEKQDIGSVSNDEGSTV